MTERTVTRTYRVDHIARDQRRPSDACVTLEADDERDDSYLNFICAVGEVPRPNQRITVRFTWEI